MKHTQRGGEKERARKRKRKRDSHTHMLILQLSLYSSPSSRPCAIKAELSTTGGKEWLGTQMRVSQCSPIPCEGYKHSSSPAEIILLRGGTPELHKMAVVWHRRHSQQWGFLSSGKKKSLCYYAKSILETNCNELRTHKGIALSWNILNQCLNYWRNTRSHFKRERILYKCISWHKNSPLLPCWWSLLPSMYIILLHTFSSSLHTPEFSPRNELCILGASYKYCFICSKNKFQLRS